MGLTSLPTRVSGSVGAAKVDATSGPYSTSKLPAGEWNNSAQAVVDVSAEVGLHDGTTSGSLVAKVKEYFRLEPLTINQFTSEDPDINTGLINPKISINNSTFELSAEGVVSPGFNAAIWFSTTSFPFQSMNVTYCQSLGSDQSVPALTGSDFLLVGVFALADRNTETGVMIASGFVVGEEGGTTWISRKDGPSGGALFLTPPVGAYLSKTNLEFFGSKISGSGPTFILDYKGYDILGGDAKQIVPSGQIGGFTGSWAASSCSDFGVIMVGSFSVPATLSLFDVRAYPRGGDAGHP